MPRPILLIVLVTFLASNALGRDLSLGLKVKPAPGFIIPYKDAHCTDYFKNDKKIRGSWARYYNYKSQGMYPSCSGFSDEDFSGAENGNAPGCEYLAFIDQRPLVGTDVQSRQRLLERA